MNSKLFFVQIKENLHLLLAESCFSGSGHSCCLTQLQLSLCRFVQRLNQSKAAASLAIENGLGILFWIANWKASLLTSSRVHLKYFRSINEEIFNKLFFKILRPNFDWVV